LNSQHGNLGSLPNRVIVENDRISVNPVASPFRADENSSSLTITLSIRDPYGEEVARPEFPASATLYDLDNYLKSLSPKPYSLREYKIVIRVNIDVFFSIFPFFHSLT